MKVVRDDHDSEPLLGQRPDEVQHLPRLRHAEGGRRLVEDDDARVPHHRLRHRHGLTLPAREAGNSLPDGLQRRHGQALERLARAPLHRRLVQHDAAEQPLAAEEHVRHHVEVVRERQVLVDDLDPEPSGVARAVDVDRLALDQNLALVERVNPAIPLISVDFPAPLSPTRAMTSPGSTSKSTL